MHVEFTGNGKVFLTPAPNPRMRPWITDDDKAAVMAVLDRGDLMSGREVALFEDELAAYFGKRHAVCVSSGTAALECALYYWGEGNKIHPDGYMALVNAAKASEHKPECSAGFGVRTHVLGILAMPVTKVIDAAHTFQKDTPGEVCCYSFAPNKFIACCGGAVVTNDSVVAAFVRHYRNHGRDGGPEVHREGKNLRLPEMNAALGRSQLKRIDDILAQRKQVARWYDEITGQKLADARESWFLYPWRGRPLLAKKHRSLADFRLFDTATQGDYETALLPIFPTMTKMDVENICKGL